MKGIGVALVPLLLLRANCAPAPTSPNASPTPSASPVGKVGGTALDNLPLIRELEKATNRGGLLFLISGYGHGQNGQLSQGSGWAYMFAQARSTGAPRLYYWTAWSDGRVTFDDDYPNVGRLTFVEIGPSVAVDSPEAIRRGREYGAQPFVDRFPGTHVQMSARSIGGRVVWDMRFEDVVSPNRVLCGVDITIDAGSGNLLLRDLSCLSQ